MASDILDWQDSASSVEKGQRNEMQLIARAADVLRALADQPQGRSLGQIAKVTGLARSTVQRIIGALEVEGFVSTKAGQAGAKLGVELIKLASSTLNDIRHLCRPNLAKLALETGETVELTKLNDNGPVVIDFVESQDILRIVTMVGRTLPIHATAAGKAHLMMMKRKQAQEFVFGKLVKLTDYTQTKLTDVMALADTYSPFAFAHEREEFHLGVCAVAVPLNVPGYDSHALVVNLPSARMGEKLELVKVKLRLCQTAIEVHVREAAMIR